MSDFFEKMADAVLEMRRQLKREGVSDSALDRIIGNPGKGRKEMSANDMLNEAIRRVTEEAQSGVGSYTFVTDGGDDDSDDSDDSDNDYNPFDAYMKKEFGPDSDFMDGMNEVSKISSYLPKNNSTFTTNTTTTKTITAPTADALSTTKYPQQWIGKPDVIVVIDYSDKTHAIFGDFVKTYLSFKNDYLKSSCMYNKNLRFGAGWTLTKSKLPELRKALKDKKIQFREVSNDAYIKELSKNEAKVVEISENSAEESEEKTVVPKTTKSKTVTKGKDLKTEKKEELLPPKSKEKTKVAVSKKDAITLKKEEAKEPVSKNTKNVKEDTPKSKNSKNDAKDTPTPTEEPTPADTKPKITKNCYGNFEEDGTCLVFMRLPIGVKGKLMNVCVGYQNPLPARGEKGHETVFGLTDEFKEEAAKNSHKILDEAMIEKVRVIDSDLADQLDEITIRGFVDEDEEVDDDGLDVEEEEEGDDDEDDS